MAEPVELTVGDIDHALLRPLHRYWLSKCGDRGHPSRQDIDPIEIPELLPHVMLLDVMDRGRRFRFRLVGTAVASGKDPTGRFLHEAAPQGPYGHHINALYAQAARLERPFYTAFVYDFTDRGGPRSIHRLFLPLSGDESAIDMMLVGQVAESPAVIDYSAWQRPPNQYRAEKLVVVEPDRH